MRNHSCSHKVTGINHATKSFMQDARQHPAICASTPLDHAISLTVANGAVRGDGSPPPHRRSIRRDPGHAKCQVLDMHVLKNATCTPTSDRKVGQRIHGAPVCVMHDGFTARRSPLCASSIAAAVDRDRRVAQHSRCDSRRIARSADQRVRLTLNWFSKNLACRCWVRADNVENMPLAPRQVGRARQWGNLQ